MCCIVGMERLVRLRDGQWSRVASLLPRETRTGGRNAKPHRPMVEAMLWILRTGAPWRDLPPAYGPWKSVYTRFSRWSQAGVLMRLFEALARERDDEGFLIDATIVRAHQDGSGAQKKRGRNTSGARAEVRPRRSMRSSMRWEIPYGWRCRRVRRTR
jgi:transposase